MNKSKSVVTRLKKVVYGKGWWQEEVCHYFFRKDKWLKRRYYLGRKIRSSEGWPPDDYFPF